MKEIKLNEVNDKLNKQQDYVKKHYLRLVNGKKKLWMFKSKIKK